MAAVVLGGCNHCASIDERICADLGADCSIWRNDQTLRGMVIPAGEYRRRARESTCEALGDDAVYSARTLPMVRNYILHLRNPRAPQMAIPTGAPPTSGGGYLYYLLMPLAVVGVFAYRAYYMRVVAPKVAANQQTAMNDAAAAQARALAEWQAQQAAAGSQQGGGPGGSSNG